MPTTSPSMRIFSFFLLLVLLFVGPVQVLSGPLGDRVTELERKQTNADTLQKVTEKQLEAEKRGSESLIQLMNQQLTVVSVIASAFTVIIILAGFFGFKSFRGIKTDAKENLDKFSDGLQQELERNNQIAIALSKDRLEDLTAEHAKQFMEHFSDDYKVRLTDGLKNDIINLQRRVETLEKEKDENETKSVLFREVINITDQNIKTDSLFEDFWKRKAQSEMTEQDWQDYAEEAFNKIGPEKAIAILQEGVKHLPESSKLYYSLGFYCLKQNQFFSSLLYLYTANHLQPNYLVVFYYLTSCYLYLNNPELSLQLCKTYQASRNNPSILLQLIWAYMETKDWKNAKKFLELATKQFPDESRFYGLYIDYYINIKNFPEAEKAALKSIELGANTNLSLVEVYTPWKTKRPQAKEELNKLNAKEISRGDKLALHFYTNILAFLEREKLETCTQDLQKAFQGQPQKFFLGSIFTITNWANDPDNGLTAKQTEGVKALLQIALDHNQRLRDEDKARTDKKYGKGTWEKYCLAKPEDNVDWEALKEI